MPDISRRGGVLITRPEPGASATARRIEALGWTPVLAPMLLIRPTAASLPEPGTIAAVVVTSAASLAFLPARLRGTPLFAVGDATAEAARVAGFDTVESAAADARALADLVAGSCRPDGPPILLATATGQGRILAADLRARGIRVMRRTVYAARLATELPPDALASLDRNEVSMTLVFSAATARALVHALNNSGRAAIVKGIDALVISEATAAELAPLPWRRIRVASHPNQDEMLALLT